MSVSPNSSGDGDLSTCWGSEASEDIGDISDDDRVQDGDGEIDYREFTRHFSGDKAFKQERKADGASENPRLLTDEELEEVKKGFAQPAGTQVVCSELRSVARWRRGLVLHSVHNSICRVPRARVVSSMQMCVFLERGALGSLKRAKNSDQERFFFMLFSGVDFGPFFF